MPRNETKSASPESFAAGHRAGSGTTAAFGFGAPKENSVVQADPWSSRKWRLIIPIALFVLAFGIYLALVETLSAYDVLHQWNVFFDTDPITYTNIYANGWHQVEVAHPLARFLLAPIVRVISSIIGASGIALGDPLRVRETIMLVVWCAANALKPPLAYGIARLFGTSITTAAAIGVLAAFSYSALVFSVVPESYGLSGLFLTMIFFGAAWTCCRRSTAWSEAGLQVAGFLAAGMTITIWPLTESRACSCCCAAVDSFPPQDDWRWRSWRLLRSSQLYR